MADETFKKVRQLIIKRTGIKPEKVVASAEFYKDIQFDSLEDVEFIIEVEEEFGIQIPDEESQRMVLVDNLVRYIDSKIAEKGLTIPI